jgi:PAS domain S-box-containing protein
MPGEAVMQSEQLYRALIECCTDAITLITSDGTIIYASPTIGRITGYAPEELVRTNGLAFIHPDDQEGLRDQLARLTGQNEECLIFEYRLQHKDGAWHWIEGTFTNRLNHPQIGAIVWKHHDISRYKQRLTEEQSARTEAEKQARQYRAIFEAMTDGVGVCDQLGRINHTNAAFRTLFSLATDADPVLLYPHERGVWSIPRDLTGKLLPQEQWPLFRVLRGEDLSSPHTMKIICRDRSGQDHFLDVSGTALRDAIGEIVGGVAVYRDMTERYRLEQQLQDTERKYRSLVESNIIGVMVSDQQGRIYEANERLVELLGYSEEELISGAWRAQGLLTPESRSARIRAWRTVAAHGTSLPEEIEYIHKNGHIIPTLAAATAISQERTRALVMVLDISDRKETERRKQEFLSMVSHELRTPLTAIQGFLELAQTCVERYPISSQVGKDGLIRKLEAILQQAQRQSEIEIRLVGELLDVSRMEMQKFEMVLQPCNLATIVQQVVANQRMASGHPIELLLPDQPIVSVIADADRIEQALTNYLTNAFKYSPSEPVVRVQLTIEGVTARVSVYDRGQGLTLEQQQHIWDRFYQIESSSPHGTYGGGLGLGLHIVRTIIAQHQGQVGVESRPGQGSTFWFMLPLADDPTEL